MKRLMFDHFRRWFRVLLLGAVIEFVVGAFAGIAGNDERHHPLAGFQIQLCFFMGAFLLSFDLQRGLARTVAALPLTAGQIAHAWWYATVAIPSAVFSAVLFMGAGAFWLIQPGAVVAWDWLALACIFLFLWMGSAFTIVFSITCVSCGSWWRRLLNGLAGAIWGLMVGGGMFLFQDILGHPVRMVCLLTLGAVLTAVSWFRAEQFVAGRVSFRPATQIISLKRGAVRLPGGYGGIPLFISTTFTRVTMVGVTMMAIMPLIYFFMQGGRNTDWRHIVESLSGMGFFPFWVIVIFFSLMPAVMQLRLLRSLPLSATALAAVMMLVVVSPLIVFGGMTAAIAALVLGKPVALKVVSNFCLFALPPAALTLVVVAWRGYGLESYLITLFMVMVSQFVPLWLQVFFHLEKVPMSLEVAMAGAFVLFGFWLTRLLLMQSSHAYRVQANAFGNMWGQGR